MPDIKTGTIQITGLSELDKRLREMPDKLARNVMRGAVRAGAAVIQKEAKARVPVAKKAHLLKSYKSKLWKHYRAAKYGTWIQPGNIKRNIKVSPAKKAPRGTIEYHVYISDKNKNTYYWKFLEFGTSKMAAKPFMRPAFEAQKEAATVAIREYMAKRIDKELGNAR